MYSITHNIYVYGVHTRNQSDSVDDQPHRRASGITPTYTPTQATHHHPPTNRHRPPNHGLTAAASLVSGGVCVGPRSCNGINKTANEHGLSRRQASCRVASRVPGRASSFHVCVFLYHEKQGTRAQTQSKRFHVCVVRVYVFVSITKPRLQLCSSVYEFAFKKLCCAAPQMQLSNCIEFCSYQTGKVNV